MFPQDQDLSLQVARRSVEAYSSSFDEHLTREHEAAMMCRDCEEFLQLGIAAYNWLRDAEKLLHEAARTGCAVRADAPQAINYLYRRWLRPCEHAEEMIRQQEQRGFTVANLKEFHEACEDVKRKVALMEAEERLESVYSGGVFDEEFWREASKRQAS